MSETPGANERGNAATGADSVAGAADRVPAPVFDGLHLAALSSFALAQPIFDLLGRTPAFFAVRGSTSRDIVVFAFAVALVPPLALLLFEALVGLVFGAKVRRTIHLLVISCLAGLIALQVLKRTELAPGQVLLAAAAVIGVAAAAAYALFRPPRTLLTALSPAPLLFLGLFLLQSPVSKLVSTGDVEPKVVRTAAEDPVVFIVFDEFAGVSLMDRRGQVDSVRYPNFARLARGSTWYRNAVSVGKATERALPPILTGRLPTKGSLPIFADHPRSLFTLLGGSYGLEVYETVTRLCPSELCVRHTPRELRPDLDLLLSDLGVVYLHLLLPDDLAARLPSVSETWGNFRGDDRVDFDSDIYARFEKAVPTRNAIVDSFLRSLTPRRRPTLYFLHVLLPHVPYQYLPSGRRYTEPEGFLAGLTKARWGPDAWLTLQAQQRYLLQVGYVDRVIGDILKRMRATGLYDRSLLLVTADHGVSFHPNERRRGSTEHPEDIAFVPLFVKLPGQRHGRVVERHVETIDILPMLARALRIDIPWAIDGIPALDGRRSSRFLFEGRPLDVAVLERGRDAALADQAASFGSGVGWARAYELGPHRRLVGRDVTQFQSVARRDVRAELDKEHLYGLVDPKGSFVPTYITGRLVGADAGPRHELAVAVNGRIAAVTRSYSGTGSTRFSAMVPEWTLRAGANEVEILLIDAGAGTITLERLGGTADGQHYELARDAAGEVIRVAGDGAIRVVPGEIEGHVDIAALHANEAQFAGWAADVAERRIREHVLVFVNGRHALSIDAPLRDARPDLGPGLEDAGFQFELPRSVVAGHGPAPTIRIFGVIDRVASELTYPANYRWRGKR